MARVKKTGRQLQEEQEQHRDYWEDPVGVELAELRRIRNQGRRKALKSIQEATELRLKVKAEDLLFKVQNTAFELMTGYEFVQTETGEALVPMSGEVRAAKKAGADIAVKLLNKVMPDLRQVEINQKNEKEADALLNDIELENRLRIYTEAKELADKRVQVVKADDE